MITFTKFWQWQRATKIEPWNLMAIERPRQFRFIAEKVIAIQRLVSHKVIDTSAIVLAAAFRDHVDQGPTVIAIFSGVIILLAPLLPPRHPD